MTLRDAVRLAAVLMTVLSAAPSAGAAPLTLEEAVALARRTSPAVLESGAQAEAARQARREARAARLPAVEVREMAIRTDSPADVFGLRLTEERFSFPAFVASDPNRPEPLDHFATQVEATLPLFTGGRLSSGIRRADRMSDAAASMRTHTESAVTLAVAEAYAGALLSDEFVALAERALATTEKHVDQARDFFDAGMIVESDHLQALVQKAVMDENLIRARNGAATARAGLNRAIGIPQDSTIALDSNLPEPPPVPASLEQAMARGRERRHDVRAVAYQTDAASAAAAAARGERWPEIALKGAYTIADDTFLGDHGRNYSLMAVARWDAWTWGRTSARVARGRSEERAASERERAYRQQADFEILQAWQSLDESRARHEVALRGVASAERAATILEDRFQQGVARVTDLLDAETSQHEARVREAQARYDVQRSLRRLLFSTGDDPVSVTAR